MPVEPIKPVVFMADDDPDDQLLMRRAWEKTNPSCNCIIFNDGQRLMDHLHYLVKRLNYVLKSGVRDRVRLPCLIVVDLNMPRKNGFEALEELKSHPLLNKIPVAMVTTSTNKDHIKRCQRLGAAVCLSKPSSLKEYYALMKRLGEICKETAPTDISLES